MFVNLSTEVKYELHVTLQKCWCRINVNVRRGRVKIIVNKSAAIFFHAASLWLDMQTRHKRIQREKVKD